ncbi:MAG: ThiF family adenylyltransferase [Candidatus Hodarchaeales archaeon]|jgi:ubiquitin-activating enzyme E1 C
MTASSKALEGEQDVSRYERQERLFLWDQNIIRRSTCLIAGVGGIGCEIAKNLALLGIGELILVDNDIVEYSNLNRQFLFTDKDVGKSKAEIAATVLQKLNPDVTITYLQDKIQAIPMNVFEKSDAIVGCFDNWLARVFLNEMAVSYRKPLIDGASEGFFARMRNVLPGITACLGCFDPVPPDETLALDVPCTLVGKPRRREHCGWIALYRFTQEFERMPTESSEDVEVLFKRAKKVAQKHGFDPLTRFEIRELLVTHAPSVISVNAVIAGLMSSEIIKALFFSKKSQGTNQLQKELESLSTSKRFSIPALTIYSSLTGTCANYDQAIDPNCKTCGSKTRKIYEITTEKGATFADLEEEIKQILGFAQDTTLLLFRGDRTITQSQLLREQVHDGDCLVASVLEQDTEKIIRIRFS